MENLTLVFVYGSLKRGFHNHSLLKNSQSLGEAKTNPEFVMYSAGGFPIIIRGKFAITGELYAVNSATLKKLDRLESNGRMYKRELTWISSIQQFAWIYVYMYDDFRKSDSMKIKTDSAENIQTWLGGDIEMDRLLDA